MKAGSHRAEAHPYFEKQIRDQLAVRVRRHDDGTRSYLILAAVLQEWAEVGLLSAQMTTIAARAGVSTATLYRLFPNRDDMHLETLALGQQMLVEAMKKCPSNPNPVRALFDLAHHYCGILQEPYFKQFSLSQTFLVRMDSPVREQASVIAVASDHAIKQFWRDRVEELVKHGFVREASLTHMIFRLIGPIEARTLHWYQSGRGTYLPEQGWANEISAIVEAFFDIYGTEKYQLARKTMGWGLANFGSGQPLTCPASALAEVAEPGKRLLHLEALEHAVATGPLPADFIDFVEAQLNALLSHKSHRLDTGNRYLRIVAATLFENYRVGFEQISMSGVAKRAGVSTKTLYRTFPDNLNLYQEAHSLGLAFFSAWVSRDIEQANPLRRLCDYVKIAVDTYLDPRSLQVSSIQFGLLADRGRETRLQTSHFIKGYIFDFWTRRFSRLKEENYLEGEIDWAMIHALYGPIQSMSWGHKSNLGATPKPEGSWAEACWRVATDFFAIYGTPQFHAMREKMDWDGDQKR
ncbi:TetR/AcrR family transcriptional regulator [Aquidulcibacter sp.]|uniref:TetR/AcrR family transcriptional regulator n=1 Tax=Aquidulcibacter sp. TaxID=2052990 RepID=UPI0025C00CD8|nr:TetR/AcrR family transcriptional regulator [Aquidulcibacter sp.]MCA3695242.1 TetR/AcrR family transcriptional regulator [Aquidulcibacter sp.]